MEEANIRITEILNFTEILKDLSISMNTKIQGKASLSDSVRRVHYDEAVTALGAAIDDKATADSMRICAEKMKVRIDCCSCFCFLCLLFSLLFLFLLLYLLYFFALNSLRFLFLLFLYFCFFSIHVSST